MAEREGVGVVGWWATWPALERSASSPPLAIVSDRALFALTRPAAGDYRIAPPSLARRLNAEFEEDLRGARRLARLVEPVLEEWRRKRPEIEQAALIDGYATQVSLKLLRDPAIRDLFVYLPGLDIARVEYARRYPAVEDRMSGLYAEYVGQCIGTIAGMLESQDWLMVIATPGRRGPGNGIIAGGPRATEEPRSQASEPEVLPHDAEDVATGEAAGRDGSRPADWGRVVVSGPGVSSASLVPGSQRPEADSWTILDIAPTLLNLRGFPVSREMEGQARVSFLDPSWQVRLRPRMIETYGENPLPSVPFSETSSEEETLERLRSLGYVK
jgi:hypothetical protein